MKAIILAGGRGSRLYPLTLVASKQLQAVYDKPMIYYPLTVLMAAGIREFCVITTPEDQPRFQALLGDGRQWGISIEYRVQERPAGIAQAFLIAADFIAGEAVTLALGDNIFVGGDAIPRALAEFSGGALIFAYRVTNPRDYGVVEFDAEGRVLSLEEKPREPRSHYAVPGLYIFDSDVVGIARGLKPSARGELEITDVNRAYMDAGRLKVRRLSRGFAWLDAGTSAALQEAAAFIETVERRQGIKFGCPEEAALQRGFLNLEAFAALTQMMPDCEYRHYLEAVAAEARDHALVMTRDAPGERTG
ncbi:glucose-1-phosphate thymidylyltransferase RfbA [Aurantimonas marianensis]|uniref:Glucose-1-phosphate thymidylyltransferase n=1 Tax=Aurantimonas marianensis TaxID=2920428 RepID=A0A9X2H820_9HYPH|nr:glucose-1-phosphate thymidylyltransferase RfbA [Aurantimonas marianensis]